MPDFVLSVIHSDDTKYDYNVNSFMTVGQLMKLINEQKDISEFRLVKGKIFLDEEKSLQDYHITPEDTIVMIENPKVVKAERVLQDYDITTEDASLESENSKVMRRILPIMGVPRK
jgi:uncharacterized ubiquitin-like protein YukD